MTLNINGMSCSHCAAAVTKALSAVEGVVRAEVTPDFKSAIIETDREIDMSVLKTAIDDIGFELAD